MVEKNYAVLSFHIKSYKTEREGKGVIITSADSVYEHNTGNSVSDIIEHILLKYNLYAEDLLNVSADFVGNRDIGSWDFWLFFRNPKARRYTRPANDQLLEQN